MVQSGLEVWSINDVLYITEIGRESPLSRFKIFYSKNKEILEARAPRAADFR